MRYYLSPPPANAVSRILAAVVAGMAIVGAFFFGLAVLLVLFGTLLVFGLIFWLRSWWFGRHPGAANAPRAGVERDASDIDAEYTLGPVNTMRMPSVGSPIGPGKARRAQFGRSK